MHAWNLALCTFTSLRGSVDQSGDICGSLHLGGKSTNQITWNSQLDLLALVRVPEARTEAMRLFQLLVCLFHISSLASGSPFREHGQQRFHKEVLTK